MKVKEQEPKDNKNEALRSSDLSQQQDTSDLYNRGQQFVKQKEAKLNELRQQQDSKYPDRDRSKSIKRGTKIFDEIDTNERVENRLISYGKSKEMRMMEQRKLKELEEQNKKFSFAPEISKKPDTNPQSDLL